MPEGQYNALVAVPEGSDWDGTQHRETKFASPEAKAAHDAPGLLALARQTYRRQIVTVDEALSLRRRRNSVSGDDDAEVSLLRRAMAIKLTEKPAWEAFVDKLDLSDKNREKLRAMLTPEAYQLSLQAYRERGGTVEPPTLDQIKAEIMTWSVNRLRQECEMREQPTLLIVSDNSFQYGIQAMDDNKHYQNAAGDQNDAYVYEDSDSPYVGAPKPNKRRVSIVDGVVHPKQLEEVSSKLGARRKHLTEKFKRNGLRHIDDVEMATLLQRSLIEAKRENDNDLIVDNWESGEGTATVINPKTLTKSTLVAFARFDSHNRHVHFGASVPGNLYGVLRGRASSQVMEF